IKPAPPVINARMVPPGDINAIYGTERQPKQHGVHGGTEITERDGKGGRAARRFPLDRFLPFPLCGSPCLRGLRVASAPCRVVDQSYRPTRNRRALTATEATWNGRRGQLLNGAPTATVASIPFGQ